MFGKTKFRIVLTITFIITLLVQPQPVLSATVWIDDFEDGDLEGWDVNTYCASNPNTIPWELCTNVISNTNNQLLLDYAAKNVGGFMGVAIHNSTSLYGQWSFDLKSDAGSVVNFMFVYNMPQLDLVGYTWNDPVIMDAYSVQIYTSNFGNYSESGVRLFHYTEGYVFGAPGTSVTDYRLDNYNFTNRAGPLGDYHIDITRKLDGNMTVYVDSEKVMSGINNEITNSTQLAILSTSYAVTIDNIVVSDEITVGVPTTTPTSTTVPSSSTPPSSTTDSSTKDNSPLYLWIAIPSLLVLIILSKKRYLR